MLDQQATLAQQAAGRDPNEIVLRGVREPYIDGPTVASVQTIFSRTRLSHQSWAGRQLDGRIDSRSVWRNDARGQVDIFRDRRAPSVTKVDVWLLIDSSGSMLGPNICRAQDIVGTLVEAFKRQPSVSLHVWQHNAGGQEVSLYRVYERGGVNKVNRMIDHTGRGNADGFALDAVGQMAIRNKRPDTKSLVIMVSDGLPSVHGRGAINYAICDHSANVSQALRDKGVGVMAVAINGTNDQHRAMYGAENVVAFEPRDPKRWPNLARDFAALFARTIRGGAR